MVHMCEEALGNQVHLRLDRLAKPDSQDREAVVSVKKTGRCVIVTRRQGQAGMVLRWLRCPRKVLLELGGTCDGGDWLRPPFPYN